MCVHIHEEDGRTHVSGQGWGELRQTDHICSQELGWVPLWSGLVSLLGGLVFQSHSRLLNGACLKREWGKEKQLVPSQPYK